ncbi:MAG: AP endonuclease, partial [Chryseobacterium sp.]
MKSVFNGLVLLVHLTILALSCLMLLNAVVPPRSFPYLN